MMLKTRLKENDEDDFSLNYQFTIGHLNNERMRTAIECLFGPIRGKLNFFIYGLVFDCNFVTS